MALIVLDHPKFKEWGPRTREIHRNHVIAMFERAGHSNHSANCLLLPFVIQHCQENNISFRLTMHPGQGAFIVKIDTSYTEK